MKKYITFLILMNISICGMSEMDFIYQESDQEEEQLKYALQEAICKGEEGTCDCLLSHFNILKSKITEHDSILAYALKEGQSNIIRMLLRKQKFPVEYLQNTAEAVLEEIPSYNLKDDVAQDLDRHGQAFDILAHAGVDLRKAFKKTAHDWNLSSKINERGTLYRISVIGLALDIVQQLRDTDKNEI